MAPSHSTAPIQTIPVTQTVTASIRVLLLIRVPVSIQKIRLTVLMCVPVSIHVTVST